MCEFLFVQFFLCPSLFLCVNHCKFMCVYVCMYLSVFQKIEIKIISFVNAYFAFLCLLACFLMILCLSEFV